MTKEHSQFLKTLFYYLNILEFFLKEIIFISYKSYQLLDFTNVTGGAEYTVECHA